MRCGGSDGKGEVVEDGFVVFEGIHARIKVAPSGVHAVNSHRERLIAAGVMVDRNGVYIFTQNFLFSSPGTAASVVLGKSANEWVEREDEGRATMSDVFRSE